MRTCSIGADAGRHGDPDQRRADCGRQLHPDRGGIHTDILAGDRHPLPTATEGGPTETPTLLPGGVTATPVLCDALIYDPATIDVNVPDNTEMQLGQEFVKTWLVKNNGSCTWGAGLQADL